jgi:hypothetical protein
MNHHDGSRDSGARQCRPKLETQADKPRWRWHSHDTIDTTPQGHELASWRLHFWNVLYRWFVVLLLAEASMPRTCQSDTWLAVLADWLGNRTKRNESTCTNRQGSCSPPEQFYKLSTCSAKRWVCPTLRSLTVLKPAVKALVVGVRFKD